MKRALAAVLLALWLLAGHAAPLRAGENPSDPVVETTGDSVARAVYFPFLVLGHGLLLVGKYGIAYPIWFVFKPVYDTLYESSEDPDELSEASG